MAMLAEPKRRQKLSSDPRNSAWSNDTNKFGHQLMEKMGWKQGKGLGINEDGKTSHISVSLKNNTLGLGCSQERGDNWISHQDDFNDLLNSLNQNQQDAKKKSKPQSLQEKSKKAKNRVHYKKFTAGKDLSTYDDHAMNCIMGVRQSSNTPQNQSENASDDEACSEDGSSRVGFGFSSSIKPVVNVSHQDNDFGVVTTTSTNSMQEYFAKKMKALHEKRNISSTSEMGVYLECTGEADCEPTTQNNNTEESTYQRKKKKSKRKRKNKEIQQCTEEESDSPDKAMDQDDCKEVHLNNGIKTEKKKKKKRKKVEDAAAVVCNEDLQNDESNNDKIGQEGPRKKKETTKKVKKRKNQQS
ncbi:PIN2/TERF1-interacting telomerase inhibitor 1-like [Asterias rubens]|uniref:PIN2/TERF1-interacting telomerase inhibitor 1-like n=1 Tax=Asterias rubens TaxID=7604 RepID=UPI001454F579|nr:PIN2/TERF1-interacting telomerase inhibitor 1-like [Asterias rubens]